MELPKIKKTIKDLFEQDQADRSLLRDKDKSSEKIWNFIKARDRKRIETMKDILKANHKLNALGYFRAGIIFQHGGSVNMIKKAQALAKEGAALGHVKSKWLYAAATDRALMMQGKKQKFGTQYHRKKSENSPWELYPVNPKTTDAERKRFNVVSLRMAQKKAVLLNKRELKSKKTRPDSN